MAGMSESVSFDRAAGYYDRTRSLPDSLMARLIPLLLAEIPQDGRCLEIGIGTGRIALPLAGAGVAMVGIDISREMLRRLIANARRSAPRVLIADATQLPFADDTFSSAVAAHVFHLIPSWEVAVSELLRVVRPGGIILASRGNRSRGTRQRILVALERRRSQPRAFAWRFRYCAFGRVINARTIALFNNCFRNPVRQFFAIFGVARFAAFQPIAQKPAFHEDRRIFREPQDAEICRVHAPIGRMGDRHELGLDSMGQVDRICRMIIRFESANSAPT